MEPLEIEQVQSPAQVLSPAGAFFHRACCCKVLGLFGAFAALICTGSILFGAIPILHLALVSLCPTMIIMGFFAMRYQRSATKRQLLYTFWEAIGWMVPLLMFILVVDNLINAVAAGNAVAVCEVTAFEANIWMNTLKSDTWTNQMQPGGGLLKLQMDAFDREIAQMGIEHGGSGLLCTALQSAPGLAGTYASLASIEQAGHVPSVTKLRYIDYLGNEIHFPIRVETEWEVSYDCSDSVPPVCTGPGVKLTFAYKRNTVLHAFLLSYFRAAGLEEALKYIAVRRVVFKDHVVDPGSVIVYGLGAAAGFATIENVQYVMSSGLSGFVGHSLVIAYMRMFLAIPLHCVCGLIIGINLSYRKFLGQNYHILQALGVPVLVHGSYDFFLFVDNVMPIGGIFGALLSLIGGFIYCRFAWLKLDTVCVVDVRALERAGQISAPSCCCCQRDCCPCSWAREDTLLPGQAAPQVPGSAEAPQTLSFTRRSLTEVFPPAPTCQTVEASCPSCQGIVRRHIRFPSSCPQCGTNMPDFAAPPAAFVAPAGQAMA